MPFSRARIVVLRDRGQSPANAEVRAHTLRNCGQEFHNAGVKPLDPSRMRMSTSSPSSIAVKAP
ncbi:hypothetical protein H5410_057702 [Solanum commersonii]|uniref:Uncharacterized protein n=1 Tax=Solanum commersonii TaxID=4109 RepID=A0A9J5WRD2_SOLCO|nr:hypothetical protein H5410_057702 [Solanum commersonii]